MSLASYMEELELIKDEMEGRWKSSTTTTDGSTTSCVSAIGTFIHMGMTGIESFRTCCVHRIAGPVVNGPTECKCVCGVHRIITSFSGIHSWAGIPH